jgi:hypothetical protein
MGETNDLAGEHPDVVKKVEEAMKEAFRPNSRYPIGAKYQGSPLWKK